MTELNGFSPCQIDHGISFLVFQHVINDVCSRKGRSLASKQKQAQASETSAANRCSLRQSACSKPNSIRPLRAFTSPTASCIFRLPSTSYFCAHLVHPLGSQGRFYHAAKQAALAIPRYSSQPCRRQSQVHARLWRCLVRLPRITVHACYTSPLLSILTERLRYEPAVRRPALGAFCSLF